MSTARLAVLCVSALLAAPLAASAQSAPPGPRSLSGVSTLSGFVENRGQWEDGVLFSARRGGVEAVLLRDALVLAPLPEIVERSEAERAADSPPTTRRAAPVVIRFPEPSVVDGLQRLPTAHHFFLGERRASDVPGYAQVVYRDVARGVDLVVRQDATGFAYDLHVAPGGDLSGVELLVEGALGFQQPSADVLVAETPWGELSQRIGASWEVLPSGEHRAVTTSRFVVRGVTAAGLSLGFDAPGRDMSLPFVLDPGLEWLTYIGGSGQELLNDVHVGPDGTMHLLVMSYDATTPTTWETVQPWGAGEVDLWVGRLSPDGTTLEWGTFLGGSLHEEPLGLGLMPDGSVMVGGKTWSADFPVTPGALQTMMGGPSDLVGVRLSPNGSALEWSTFYGESKGEGGTKAAVCPFTGDLLLAGEPLGPVGVPVPATDGAYDPEFVQGKQFLSRLSADGSHVVFHTYFWADRIGHIRFDSTGNLVLAGGIQVAYTPFLATPGAFKTVLAPGDGGDGFVAKLDASGTTLHWATYLGGSKSGDTIQAVSLDAADAIYLSGRTNHNSGDFPVTAGAFDTVPKQTWVAKLLPHGSNLVWSSYLAGCCTGTTNLMTVVADTSGSMIVCGSSNQANFPVTPDAFQSHFIGPSPSGDLHITKLDPFGASLIYSTYLGASGSDTQPRMGLDAADQPHIAFRSSSPDLPVTPEAFQDFPGGSVDTAVMKFTLPVAPWMVLGGGLKGSKDVPNLAGGGALQPGSATRLSLRGGAPASLAMLVVGLPAVNLPLKGGTLVPAPLIQIALPLDSQGQLDLIFPWPSVPGGVDLYMQVWNQDTGATGGWSASNALALAVP